MPTLAFALLGGKLKIICGLSAAGVSASSIPIALTTGNAKQKGIFTKEGMSRIGGSLANTSKLMNTHLAAASQKLKEEYEMQGNKMSDVVSNETMENVQERWKGGEEVVENAYKYIHKNAKNINYYAFVLGNPVKSFVLMVPKIIRDSIVHNDQTKRNQQLLSIQKIIAVSKKEGFEEFSGALLQLMLQYQEVLKNITVKDGLGVLKIFREIREEDYDLFMQQIKENIKQMQREKNYTSSTDLLKDIFVGVDSIRSFEENKQKLKKLIVDMKDRLKKIQELDESEIEALIKDLSAIEPPEG